MDQYSDPNSPLSFDDLFGKQIYNPALGLTLARNPEVLAMHFAAQGVEPPKENLVPAAGPSVPIANPSETQHTIEPRDTSEAPSDPAAPSALSPSPDPTATYGTTANVGNGFGLDWLKNPKTGALPLFLDKILPGGPASAHANPVEGSAPGSPAPGLPPPSNLTPHPIGEPAFVPGAPTGSGDAKPAPNPDDGNFMKALAGLKAFAPPAGPRISSPPPPHNLRSMPQSQLLQLVQSLTQGSAMAPPRTLGELLQGR